MLTRLLFVLTAALLAFAAPTLGADIAVTPRVEARLVAEQQGVPADGGTITVALSQKIKEHWHTYWRNPGDSGEPTAIQWTLPPGFSASPIAWPHPQRLPVGPLMNFGYSDQVLLLTDIKVPGGLKAGDNVTLKADATWLVCEEICIPEQASLDLTLPVVSGEPFANSQWRQAFQETRARMPSAEAPVDGRFASDGQTVTLFFVPKAGAEIEGAEFFPATPGLIKNAAPQIAQPREGGFAFELPVGSKLRDPERAKDVDKIDGVLVLGREVNGVRPSFEVSLARGAVPAAASAVSTGAGEAPLNLFTAIGFALLGGLILNLMPCVFPILSMKALALVRSHHAERPWGDGVAYTAGVLATFTALAAALMGLRAVGEDVGWGFQLQSPLVVAGLAYVLFLVGLNLSGVFQVGGAVQSMGQELSSKSGHFGSFLTGVLAVVVAAPCTAPFMGAAMGFAFTQSNAVIFAVFLALGLGLALPWLLLSLSPRAIRMLPKPGPWMERFKQFLAFPMYGAAAWLLWVLSQQVAPDGLARVLVGMIGLALAAWAFGVVQSRAIEGRARVWSWAGVLIGLGALIAAMAAPLVPAAGVATASTGSSALGGEAYTAQRLAALRAEKRPVLVNLTAAWCITCLLNERVALSSEDVARAFKATNTAYLIGDWTNRNAEISQLLRAHGREGVPLYLYYPAGADAPQVLPQILTEAMIISTLKTEGN